MPAKVIEITKYTKQPITKIKEVYPGAIIPVMEKIRNDLYKFIGYGEIRKVEDVEKIKNYTSDCLTLIYYKMMCEVQILGKVENRMIYAYSYY